MEGDVSKLNGNGFGQSCFVTALQISVFKRLLMSYIVSLNVYRLLTTQSKHQGSIWKISSGLLLFPETTTFTIALIFQCIMFVLFYISKIFGHCIDACPCLCSSTLTRICLKVDPFPGALAVIGDVNRR